MLRHEALDLPKCHYVKAEVLAQPDREIVGVILLLLAGEEPPAAEVDDIAPVEVLREAPRTVPPFDFGLHGLVLAAGDVCTVTGCRTRHRGRARRDCVVQLRVPLREVGHLVGELAFAVPVGEPAARGARPAQLARAEVTVFCVALGAGAESQYQRARKAVQKGGPLLRRGAGFRCRR